MRLSKKQTPAIDKDDIWKDDKLERKEIAEQFTKIISTIHQPFVISINSPYGTGKTFFTKRWQETLKADGYATVYFNAWETDYSKDALLAFMSTLRTEVKDYIIEEDAAKLGQLISTTASFIAKRSLPLMAKTGARVLLGTGADDLEKAIDTDLANFTEGFVKASLEGHEEEQGLQESFKKELTQLPELLKKHADIHQDQIIVFIDDLDRCRPSYTIEALECIKHFFSVPNYIFILMVDDNALSHAISSVYSPELSTDNYLRKFIEWRANLPEPSRYKYAQYLYEVFNLDELDCINTDDDKYSPIYGKEALIIGFSMAAIIFNRTLRQMSQDFITLNLILRSLSEEEKPFVCLMGYLTILKESSFDEFKNYIDGGIAPPQTSLSDQMIEWNQVMTLDLKKMFQISAFTNNQQFKNDWENYAREIEGKGSSLEAEHYKEKCFSALMQATTTDTLNSFYRACTGTPIWKYIRKYFKRIEGLIQED